MMPVLRVLSAHDLCFSEKIVCGEYSFLKEGYDFCGLNEFGEIF